MNANLAIQRERTWADERGQLACRASPRKVHLKEAVLRVEEAHRACNILPAAGPDRGNPERITRNRDGGLQAPNLSFTVEEGKARSEPTASPESGGEDANY